MKTKTIFIPSIECMHYDSGEGFEVLVAVIINAEIYPALKSMGLVMSQIEANGYARSKSCSNSYATDGYVIDMTSVKTANKLRNRFGLRAH